MRFHDLFAIAYPLLADSPPPVHNEEVEVQFDLALLWSDAPDEMLEALDVAAVKWHLRRFAGCEGVADLVLNYEAIIEDDGAWVNYYDAENNLVASFTAHEATSAANGGNGKPLLVRV